MFGTATIDVIEGQELLKVLATARACQNPFSIHKENLTSVLSGLLARAPAIFLDLLGIFCLPLFEIGRMITRLAIFATGGSLAFAASASPSGARLRASKVFLGQ